MHKPTLRSLLVLTLVTLIGATAAFAEPKPIHTEGTAQGNVAYLPTVVGAGVFSIKVEASGPFSHLGLCHATWEGSASLDADLGVTPLKGAGWKITAADGSTMSGPVDWQAQATAEPGVFLVTGPFRIARGTGRYQGATGSGTIRGIIDVLTGESTLKLEGDVLQAK